MLDLAMVVQRPDVDWCVIWYAACHRYRGLAPDGRWRPCEALAWMEHEQPGLLASVMNETVTLFTVAYGSGERPGAFAKAAWTPMLGEEQAFWLRPDGSDCGRAVTGSRTMSLRDYITPDPARGR